MVGDEKDAMKNPTISNIFKRNISGKKICIASVALGTFLLLSKRKKTNQTKFLYFLWMCVKGLE